MAEIPLYHTSAPETDDRIRYHDFRIRRSVHVPGELYDLGRQRISEEYRSYDCWISVQTCIEKNEMGYACAVGVVLMVIALVINFIQLIATGTFHIGKKKED